jgi:tellurite resistance protein TerC
VKQGVGLILFVAGTKMLLLIFHIKVPLSYALSIILGILLISIIASMASNKNNNTPTEKKV